MVLGDTYGAGNGSTTFNVPQLQGKTPQGYDGNTYNLAGTGGANTVTVAVTNNQAVSSVTATNSVTNNQGVTVTGSIDNTSITDGSDWPLIVMNYCPGSLNPPGGSHKPQGRGPQQPK